jgi:hypothetical protein
MFWWWVGVGLVVKEHLEVVVQGQFCTFLDTGFQLELLTHSL